MKYSLLIFLMSFLGVAQNSNISIVSAEKLNVVYRGVPNPIKIAVPGAKSFTATAPGLVADTLGVGDYIFRPGAGNEVTIKIEAVMEDGSVLKQQKVFRIKGFPSLTGIIHGKSICGNYTCTKEELVNMQIDVVLEDVLLYEPNVDYGVKEFTILHISKRKKKTLLVEGNNLTNEIIGQLGEITSGSLLFIDNIKTWGSVFHGYTKRPSPIVIEITD